MVPLLGASWTPKFGSRYEAWPHYSSHEMASFFVFGHFLNMFTSDAFLLLKGSPESGPSKAAG